MGGRGKGKDTLKTNLLGKADHLEGSIGRKKGIGSWKRWKTVKRERITFTRACRKRRKKQANVGELAEREGRWITLFSP